MSGFRSTYGPFTVRGGTVTASANASGQVTVTHGRSVAPASVVVSGRNGAFDVRVSHPIAGSTTFVVTGINRTDAATVPNGTSLTFDWIAFW